MPGRHRRTLPVGRSQRRKLVWATSNVTVAALNAGGVADLDLGAPLEVAGSSLLGVTIMRTRLHYHVRDFAAVADQIETGMIIGRSSDIGVNVAGQVSAATPENDWMLLTVLDPVTSAAAVDAGARFDFDLRAKRKMQELNQKLVLSLFNNSAGAHTIDVFARVLVALP